MKFFSPSGISHKWVLVAAIPFIASCGKKNEFAPPPPTAVGVQTPIIRDQVIHFNFPGHLEARQTVELRARVRGILKTVSPDFKAGGRITKGTTVFKIDDTPYRAAYQAAEANLAKAKADLSIAEITLQRRETAAEAISKIQIDAAKADVDAAKALVLSAQASLIEAKDTLSWCTIAAPISGRISELEVDQFNLVGNNEATLLSTIVQDDTLRVYFDINERMAIKFLGTRKDIRNKKRPSVVAQLTLADGTLYKHEAVIDYADNKVDSDTGTVRVRAIVDNPDGQLADGLFVKVRVPSPDLSKDSILVPSIAIQQDLGGHYVLTVTPENKVQRKNINLGYRIDRLQLVKEGLTGKEKIIVQGLQRVREGAMVSPKLVPTESQPKSDGQKTPKENSEKSAKN